MHYIDAYIYLHIYFKSSSNNFISMFPMQAAAAAATETADCVAPSNDARVTIFHNKLLILHFVRFHSACRNKSNCSANLLQLLHTDGHRLTYERSAHVPDLPQHRALWHPFYASAADTDSAADARTARPQPDAAQSNQRRHLSIQSASEAIVASRQQQWHHPISCLTQSGHDRGHDHNARPASAAFAFRNAHNTTAGTQQQ